MTKKKKEESLVKTEPSRAISPFEEAEKWFEEIFRRPISMFGPSWFPRFRMPEVEPVSPSVDIFKDGDDIVVKAEIPGMRKDDLDVSITDDTVSISGKKRKEEKIEKKDYYRYERSEGSFCRNFHLPDGVKSDDAKAKFEDGVLEIRIPLTAEAKKKKGKKITIE